MKATIEISRGRQSSGELRSSLEDPTVPLSSANFMQFFGLDVTGNGPARVSIDEALEVPAFLAAVSFLSRTMAALPLHAYKPGTDGPERDDDLQAIIHDSPNPEWTSFEWRRYSFQQTFTGGRGVSWIERVGDKVVAIWPMDPRKTRVRMVNGRKLYKFDGKDEYPAEDVIDVPFMLKADQVTAYGPVAKGARILRLALSMDSYSRAFFNGGGVPPLAMEGPIPSGAAALQKAMDDVHRVIEQAKASDKQIFPMPPGHKLTQVGYDPAKGQLTEAQRFVVEQVARILQLPPVFVGDLTHGTFTNTAQQDLHLVKHLVGQWAMAFEQELRLKLYRRKPAGRYVEHNLDGLMRGDLTSRMAAYGVAIQNAILEPDEVRGLENRPARGGDAARLHIQGATVPLGSQPKNAAPPPAGGLTEDEAA